MHARWWNPANLFTLARLLLAPLVFLEIVRGEAFRALAIFAIAAVTDLIDGALARHFGFATPGGAYFDPIVDKILLSGVYLALAAVGVVPWWLVAIIFGRDLFILGGSCVIVIFIGVRRFPPTIWGKASTFLQIATAVFMMGRGAFEWSWLKAAAQASLWPTAAMTVWSGIHYGWLGVRLVRSHD